MSYPTIFILKRTIIGSMLFLCTISSGNAQSLQKRYKTQLHFDWLPLADHKRYFEIYPTVLNLNQEEIKLPEKLKGVYELSEKGQKEFIEQLSSKIVSADSLIVALRKTLENKESTPSNKLEIRYKIIPATFKKTFVIYVKRVLAGETSLGSNDIAFKNDLADKLDNLKLLVTTNPTSQLTFLSWDKLKNQDTTLNLGQISTTSTFSVNLNGTLGIKNTLSTEANDQSSIVDFDEATPEEGSKLNKTLTTQQNKNNSKVKDVSANVTGGGSFTNTKNSARQFFNKTTLFSGYYEPKRFYIDLMAVEGMELVGSTFITMNCKLNTEYNTEEYIKFENLSSATAITPPAAITYYKYFISYPVINAPINANLNYSFLYRSVIGKSAKFYPEYKQKIKYLYGSTLNENATPASVPLYKQSLIASYTTQSANPGNNLSFNIINTNEFNPKIFYIRINPVSSISLAGSASRIQFETYKEAMDFLAWIRTVTPTNSAAVDGLFSLIPAAVGLTVSTSINLPTVRIIEQ